ncbi:MAG: REP-associated tyrosine transposase [Pyrinomonadaceae bacterium]
MAHTQNNQPQGWHSRGYLPHFDGNEICQFITLHLGDALPQKIIERWKLELAHEKDERAKIELYKRTEKYLDQGYGKCYLKMEEIAAPVQKSLLHFDTARYNLIAWVIMPNHIHFLLKPIEPHTLSGIMHSIKSYTALTANRFLQRSGRFWQEDYFDRYIRNYEHYEKTITYIKNNPVKAGLCETPGDWKFSSAYFQK